MKNPKKHLAAPHEKPSQSQRKPTAISDEENSRKKNRPAKQSTSPTAPPHMNTRSSAKPTPDNMAKRPPAPTAARHNRAESDLPNNLRSQTPLNRRMQQKMTAPAEPGTRRRTSKPQYYRIKDDEMAPKPHIIRRIFLVLVCYAIIMPACLFAVSLWLSHHTTTETDDYVYQIGPDEDYYSRRTYPWDTVRTGDLFYLNMTEIAAYCNMATTGDDKVMRYIVKDTGETVEFVIGQSIALINGVEERVGGNTYLRNGKIYVPVDFFNRCIHGIEASVDTENNKITILRQTAEDGTPIGISFPYKPSTTTEAIRFADLDHDLQLQILIQNQPKDPPTDNNAPITDETTPSSEP